MGLYKLYGTGITDAIASLDIVADGTIYAIQWAINGDLDADGETLGVELSFSSTSGFTSNDTKSSLSTVRKVCNGTPGFTDGSINMFLPNLEIPVEAGERLYLHGTGTSVAACTCYVHVRDRSGARAQGRRVRL